MPSKYLSMLQVKFNRRYVTAYAYLAIYTAKPMPGVAFDILELALDSLGWIRAYPILNILSIPGKPSSFGFDRIAALRKGLVETFRASVGEELLNPLKIFLAAEGRRANRDN
jgi:hypothetical protein